MQSALLALFRTSPCSFSLICAMGRNYPLCRNMSGPRAQTILQAQGDNFPLDQVVEALRNMAQTGLGVLRWNSDAKEFIFAWALTPAAILEFLRSGLSFDAGTIEFKPAGEDDFDMEIEEPLCKHRFQLRQDCMIGLELPDNLTKREARKIFKYLKALAYRVPAWPFPISAKTDEFGDGLDHLLKSKTSFSEDDFLEADSDEIPDDSDDKEDDNQFDAADDDEFNEDLINGQTSGEVSANKNEKMKVNWDKF